MLLPRFTIRTLLAITAGCALFFLVFGMAFRGQSWAWAWGLLIGVISIAVTALVHAAWFGLVLLLAGLPAGRRAATRPACPSDIPHGTPPENLSVGKEASL